MGRVHEALIKSEAEKRLRQQEEKIASKKLHTQEDVKPLAIFKENVSVGPSEHQTLDLSDDLPSYVQNKQDIKLFQLSQKTEKDRKNLTEPIIDKNEIAEKLTILRSEYSKHPLKKMKVRKKFFSKKREKDLLTFLKPTSLISEYFKVIRTLLLNSIRKKGLRTILVTSSLPGEGKSFVASNLAASIACGFDQHVLLVDADLKRPLLHEILKIHSEEGLSDFLVNEQYQLNDLIKETKIPKLSFLPAGSRYESSSELLSSEVMRLFMQEVKNRYDDCHIIFDSPPAQTSETLALADKVDGVILVVRAGKTDWKLANKTAEVIGKQKILGVILNHCSVSPNIYYNYYR